VNAPMLALLQLVPQEEAAASQLYQFAAAHDGVKIVTPRYPDEPWRAEIREGAIPGESRTTSGFLVSRWPSELLAKLNAEFGGADTG
jgi:hypothetical protein